MNKLLKDQAKRSNPDLIADIIVPLFGNNGWVWLQALYEVWAWPMAKKGKFEYPFQQGMSLADKVSLIRRIKKYWLRNDSLFLLNTRPNRLEDEKNRLLEQYQHVSRQLENAYKQKDSSTINEIVEPFAKADQWFCQDFFLYILRNPLSFFDFTQIAPDADDSERPFGKHFTLLQFLNAVEKVGQYMHYNSKCGQKEYELFFSWLEKHAETLVNASASLEWEMRDNYSPMGDSPFSNWLDNTISELELAIKQEQNTTSIRDYLAAWMDPDLPFPQLDDFAKLTITRESLEILDDFACEHFNKSVHQLAYWDALRRPVLYLLANLYISGFFNELEQNLQIQTNIKDDFGVNLSEKAVWGSGYPEFPKHSPSKEKSANIEQITESNITEIVDIRASDSLSIALSENTKLHRAVDFRKTDFNEGWMLDVLENDYQGKRVGDSVRVPTEQIFLIVNKLSNVDYFQVITWLTTSVQLERQRLCHLIEAALIVKRDALNHAKHLSPSSTSQDLKSIQSLPKNIVIWNGESIRLSNREYEFLKAASELSGGENIDSKLEIPINKTAKTKVKDIIATKFKADKFQIFVEGQHFLTESAKERLRM